MNFEFKYLDVMFSILYFILALFITFVMFRELDFSDFHQCLSIYIYFLIGLVFHRFG